MSLHSGILKQKNLLSKALLCPDILTGWAAVCVDLYGTPLAVVPEQVVEAHHEGNNHQH